MDTGECGLQTGKEVDVASYSLARGIRHLATRRITCQRLRVLALGVVCVRLCMCRCSCSRLHWRAEQQSLTLLTVTQSSDLTNDK